ncbi:hypothetical protein PSTG_02658 [Puccinia striiformis f. sp. tritici PST-78]|uniref:Uncharacterized protein n=1 Tax=Puccinia striiformis f. sp. tritici PST-78 TaxID=1165861 RepID=A0A0L0VYH3_9BASI|nr:hypothetical protein PSTG_02658 [Puccinia striiformis f. sp. tritici PST-78]
MDRSRLEEDDAGADSISSEGTSGHEDHLPDKDADLIGSEGTPGPEVHLSDKDASVRSESLPELYPNISDAGMSMISATSMIAAINISSLLLAKLLEISKGTKDFRMRSDLT